MAPDVGCRFHVICKPRTIIKFVEVALLTVILGLYYGKFGVIYQNIFVYHLTVGSMITFAVFTPIVLISLITGPLELTVMEILHGVCGSAMYGVTGGFTYHLARRAKDSVENLVLLDVQSSLTNVISSLGLDSDADGVLALSGVMIALAVVYLLDVLVSMCTSVSNNNVGDAQEE